MKRLEWDKAREKEAKAALDEAEREKAAMQVGGTLFPLGVDNSRLSNQLPGCVLLPASYPHPQDTFFNVPSVSRFLLNIIKQPTAVCSTAVCSMWLFRAGSGDRLARLCHRRNHRLRRWRGRGAASAADGQRYH